eukprot:3934472-Rhodomonas_salina.2
MSMHGTFAPPTEETPKTQAEFVLPRVYNPANPEDPRNRNELHNVGNGDEEEVSASTPAQKEFVARLLKKAQRNYVLKARPKDRRYADKVHGAALAPEWKYVWTDDVTVSTDVNANRMDQEIDNILMKKVAAQIEPELDLIQELSQGPLTTQQVTFTRDRIRKLVPRDSITSRLSNLVLDLEEVAVSHMRNLVDSQIKRGAYQFCNVQHQLDIRNYGYDTRILCRSLRRDNLTFSSFGHLVGTLLCESLYIKGSHAVNYMQLRIQRSRITKAIGEAVAFLSVLDRPVKIDQLGQPDGREMFTLGGKTLLVDGKKVYAAPPGLPPGAEIYFDSGGDDDDDDDDDDGDGNNNNGRAGNNDSSDSSSAGNADEGELEPALLHAIPDRIRHVTALNDQDGAFFDVGYRMATKTAYERNPFRKRLAPDTEHSQRRRRRRGRDNLGELLAQS